MTICLRDDTIFNEKIIIIITVNDEQQHCFLQIILFWQYKVFLF